jgi:hypothetical protein
MAAYSDCTLFQRGSPVPFIAGGPLVRSGPLISDGPIIGDRPCCHRIALGMSDLTNRRFGQRYDRRAR